MILSFLLFLTLFFLVFYPFGRYLTNKSKENLTDHEIILFSLVFSIVLFVGTALILGIFKLRSLLLPTAIVFNLFSIWSLRGNIKEIFILPIMGMLKDKIFNLIAIISIAVQGFINFPSGLKYPEGYLFWSSQGHDGLWHVALIEEIKKSMPIVNPIYSGERLFNYHYLVDVLMGEFVRIFPFFSSLDLYFRFFTVVLSFLIVLSVFVFVARWQSSKAVGYWAIFFTILTGSFGYIVTFLRNGNFFSGETVFWAAQGNTIVGNPPHAISFTLITTSLLCLYFYFKTKKKYWFMATLLTGSFLAGFKVPAGVVFLAGLGFAALINYFRTRDYKPLFLLSISGLVNFCIIKFLTRGVTSFLIFEPWWFVRTMIVVPDRLGMVVMELKRQHYLAQHTWHANLRVLQLELGGFFIFVIGNLGMRVLGVLEIFYKFIYNFGKTITKPFEVAILISALTGLVIPLLFVQKGIIYNNIAFMQYFLLIFGFYGAISFNRIMVKTKPLFLKVLFVVILVIFSIPTVIGNLVDFYGLNTRKPALAKISNSEIEALTFLKNNSPQDSVILSLPFDRYAGEKYGAQPWPIYAWFSTAYIPAIASRRTYLTSEEQAMITGYDINDRREKMIQFFSEKDFVWNKTFLDNNHIDYIYLTKKEKESLRSNNYLSVFFENEDIIIYRVL